MEEVAAAPIVNDKHNIYPRRLGAHTEEQIAEPKLA